jgi:hypothetical protein
MVITIPPEEFIYVDVFIPDDLAPHELAEVDYKIESTADSGWDDLTTQTVSTDNYNQVIIPIQYNTFNRKEGECSGPFRIILSSEQLGKSKYWNAQVCVSNHSDIDFPSDVGEDTPNSDMELFDAAFIPVSKIAAPGEDVEFTLAIESYAQLTYDITPGNEIEMSLESDSAATSELDPRSDIGVVVTAPNSSGDHEFTVTVEGDCDQEFCKRTARGMITVMNEGETVPDTSFDVSIFPVGISIKEPGPVEMEVVVYNPGMSKGFTLELDLPEELESDFNLTSVEVGQNSEERIPFTVTPSAEFGFRVIKLYVSYGDRRKLATAQLSMHEMKTDVQREAEALLEQADPDTAADIEDALSEWEDEYEGSDYGDELSAYGTIRDKLSAARENAGSTEPGDEDNLVITSEEVPQDTAPIIIIVVIIAVAVAAVVIVLRKRSSGGIENAEIELN